MSETVKDRVIDLERMKRHWLEEHGTPFPQEDLLNELKKQVTKKH